MPLTADDGHSIKDAAIILGLTRKTSESISVALYLKAFELPVYDRNVDPRIVHEDSQLIDDARLAVARMASL
jgi:hypothetical protein